jgi:hypothetical protein
MIQIQGFAARDIRSLTDQMNEWLLSNTSAMDTKFRLITIVYSSTAEPAPRYSTGKEPEIHHSALALYDVGEVKKVQDSSEPLDASGVE